MSVDTFDPSALLPNFVAFLRDNDLARRPSDATDQELPPVWIDPRTGVPYPGQIEGMEPEESHPNVVMAVYPSPGIPSQPFQGFYRQDIAQLYIRARLSPLVRSTFEAIRAIIHDQRNYSLHGLQVNQSMLYRDLTRVSSDNDGFVYDCEFIFDLWGPD
jgi:hypothetical protein